MRHLLWALAPVLRILNRHLSATHGAAVQLQRISRVAGLCKLDEGYAAWKAGVVVLRQVHVLDAPELGELVAHVAGEHLSRKVAHEDRRLERTGKEEQTHARQHTA
jgi:hypothetical protein